jgi:enhancing lycopene biosynthesis protein 2
MAKRVGLVLTGCGRLDGSDVAEAMLALLVIERAGALAVCVAPDVQLAAVVDHLTGERAPAAGARNARVEAARLAGAPILPLAELRPDAVDALIIPGGNGPVAALSDYPDKREVCQVDPALAALLRAMLKDRRPMGFIGLSAVLAARVLGPVAGVRVTVGSKSIPAAKHAAVMGADVRPCVAEDVIVDQKARVFTTPGFLAEGARLAGVARAMDRLVRGVVGNARDRSPRDVAPEAAEGSAGGPAGRPSGRPAGGRSTDPGRGSA